jgi:gamma-glutamylputrescine oxidase
MYAQSLHAVEYVGKLASREGIDCQLRMTGQLVIPRGRSGRKRLHQQAAILEALALPCERLDDDALARTVTLAENETSTGNASYPAALRLPIAGLLHPGLLLHGLARSVRKRGGEIYGETPVVEITKTQPATVRTVHGETVVADHVVLATNGYSHRLGFMQGRILPVHLRLLLSEPLEPTAFDVLGWAGREAIIDSRRLFNYFRLTEDNRILFGSGLPQYLWRGATEEDAEAKSNIKRLMAEFTRTFPAAIRPRINRSWGGVIGYVLDTLPVIDRLRHYPAVVFAGGWCGHGIALSVASGAWVAHLITRQCPPENLPWFRGSAPLLPFEIGRWLSIPIVSQVMSAQDRL